MIPRVVFAVVFLAAGVVGVPIAKGVVVDPPKGIEAVTSVEGIDEYRLANGLRVLLFPDPSKETATVNVTILVGSKHEGYGETGMAHLLEHLAFKGTPGHPNIPDELTAHGCRPNGSTWYDRTNYFETFAATPGNLDWALDLEADRMVNSFIAREDLDSEMTVVRNEFEMGENNPQWILEERILSTAYLWHNYGKSTIGSRSDIENVPIDKLQAFYRKWYQPDNAVLVVAGKIDPRRTLELIAETFGRIPRPDRVLSETYTIEPAQDGERTVVLRRVGDTQVVGAAYHIPAGAHPDFPPIEILSFILGDTPSGRLYSALVESKKAATVSSWAYQLKDPGILYLMAEVRVDDSLDEAREALIRVTEEIASKGPTAAEVERARESLLSRWEQTMRNSSRAAVRLSEWSAMGDWRLMFLHRDRLREVTVDDVRRVAADYMTATNRTIGLYIPTQEAERAEIPPAPDIAALLEDYSGGEAMVAGEEFDPSPEKVESMLVRLTLPSGLKLVLLPKKTRAETIRMSLSLHFGDQGSLRGLGRIGELTGRMLMRGTKERSRQEIRDEIDRLKARLWVGGSATGAWAGLEASRETAGDALRLVGEILKSPSFPKEELQQLKQEELVRLEESKSDPSQLAYVRLFRHMNPWPRDDVRYVATPEERIVETDGITREQVAGFHSRFYGASSGELCIIGDFDPDAIIEIVEELFGAWKSQMPYERLVSDFQEISAIDETIEVPDKESAVMVGGLRIKLRDDEPDYPAMVLGNFMTGGGFLNSRLATRIRQKEGLSYGVGSQFRASAWDENAYFTARAIYAPQNAERLEAAFREEIAAIVESGFTEEEVEAAKSGWLQSRQLSRSQDRELASLLARREEQGRTLVWDADLERRISELTPKGIHDAIRRHIDPARISVVQAGDFARARQERASSAEPPGDGS